MPNFKLKSAAIIVLYLSVAVIAGCQSNIDSMLSFMNGNDNGNSYTQALDVKKISPNLRYKIEYTENEPLMKAKSLLDYGDEEEGVEQLEAFAAQGNSFAMYFLSEYYKKKGNIELGNEWREKARAAHNLLVLVFNANEADSTGDKLLIAKSRLDLAEGGSLSSQLLTGLNYIRGNGFPINYDKGIYWLHEVADLNMDQYLYEVSELKDIRHFISGASILLSELYKGSLIRGHYKNYEKYEKYLLKAAEYGSVEKQFEAACLYAYLDGHKNPKLANKFFNSVLNYQNERNAIYGKAAFAYADFLSELDSDVYSQDIAFYLNIARDKGFLDKYPEIADFYHGKSDFAKAKAYYEKSLHGDKTSEGRGLYGLGNLYYNGDGVSQNYKKALNYFNKSYKLNDPKAAFSLGEMYENGYGVKMDKAKAYSYFKESCYMNYIRGCDAMKQIENMVN